MLFWLLHIPLTEKWGKGVGAGLEQNAATLREKICAEISSEGNLL